MMYRVTFRWHKSDTFCANLCQADNEKQVRKYYRHHEILDIRPVTEYDRLAAARRGMPITDARKPQTKNQRQRKEKG